MLVTIREVSKLKILDEDHLEKNIQISDINDKIDILYDIYGVPHVFATNLEDLYFTFGYVRQFTDSPRRQSARKT